MRQNFFRCGILGWSMEIFWTGLQAMRLKDPKLMGSSSLWMFPIYGCAAFLFPVMRLLQKMCIWKRGLVYMSCIYAGEFLSGSLLRSRGLCPWDYSHSPLHYQGLVRLDFAPLWFAAGLLFERVLLPSAPTSEHIK
ncbi:MAG: hypothetical protein Q4C82_00410 [Eubacteriales bacterium]|nr:hypothetical protein [Eubacteriales bacterium]